MGWTCTSLTLQHHGRTGAWLRHDVHEATKSVISKTCLRHGVAAEALRRIGQLYQIEAAITDKPADVRLSERQARAVLLLAELEAWLAAEQRRLPRKNALGKAIQYCLGRWDATARYASDGRLAIDNNPAERALRTIAVTCNYAQVRIIFHGTTGNGSSGHLFARSRLNRTASAVRLPGKRVDG